MQALTFVEKHGWDSWSVREFMGAQNSRAAQQKWRRRMRA
jgi:hypothetical protein